jgi:aspartyl-tRNA(Asn)/glutamyl-tRNA(Gln) amidotransferase subunit B
MRSKEMVNDYRYFPEPDLPPLIVDEKWISEIEASMPELPEALFEKFTTNYGLNPYDAGVLTESKEIAAFFEAVCTVTKNYKAAANWTMVNLKGYLNENALDFTDVTIKPQTIADLIKLIDDGTISHSVASQKIFPELLADIKAQPLEVAQKLNLIQSSDSGEMDAWVTAAIAKYPEKVAEYKGGKTGLLGLFMGEVMKLSGGKADPKAASEKVRKALEA